MADNSNITLRKLEEEEWRLLREFRLYALEESCGVFTPTREQAAHLSEDHWIETLSNPDKRVFAEFDDARLVGIGGVFPQKSNPPSLLFALDFITPSHRGRGLIHLLHEARISFAREQVNYRTAAIAHRDENNAARGAILSHGFLPSGSRMKLWPGGQQALEISYSLDLQALRRG